jgi:hypothetical protein
MENFDATLMLEPVLANVVKSLADFFGTTTDAVMANAPAFLAKYGWFVKISEMGWMYALVIVLAGLFCSGLFTILDDLNGIKNPAKACIILFFIILIVATVLYFLPLFIAPELVGLNKIMNMITGKGII